MGSGSRRTSLQRELSYYIWKRASLAKGRRSFKLAQMSWGRWVTVELEKLREKPWDCSVISEREGTRGGGWGWACQVHPLCRRVACLLHYSTWLHWTTQHNRPVPDSSPSPLLSTPGALCWALKGNPMPGNPKPALWQPGGIGWVERGVQEGGNTCLPLANSCWCMAKSITLL